jgi:perosamine synthetase
LKALAGALLVPLLKIPLAKPVFDREMEEVAVEALRNERFVLGESVWKFEEEFAKYCGTDYAVSTNSGTDALHIAQLSAGIGPNRRVVTTPASFIATANAIIHANNLPVFSDINLENYTLDSEMLSKAVDAKTKAVIPVHLYGYPADMDSINAVAKKRSLVVIEDACQAHGALLGGRKAGSLGDVGCFSFYSSKNMTVGGDGGMIVTDDEKLAKQASKLRDCGRKSQYVHDMVGYTARLNTINAAIGRVQLRRLDAWNEQRRKIADLYNRLLSDVDGIVLPPRSEGAVSPVYHLYVIRTRCRNHLKTWLEGNGIMCGVHYELPIHLQPVYRKMFGFKKGLYPKSEELCKTCLSIPIYPELSSNEISFITDRIHDFFEKKGGM